MAKVASALAGQETTNNSSNNRPSPLTSQLHHLPLTKSKSKEPILQWRCTTDQVERAISPLVTALPRTDSRLQVKEPMLPCNLKLMRKKKRRNNNKSNKNKLMWDSPPVEGVRSSSETRWVDINRLTNLLNIPFYYYITIRSFKRPNLTSRVLFLAGCLHIANSEPLYNVVM